MSEQKFDIVGLNFVSLYMKDHQAAIDFYTAVFGPPENVDEDLTIHGWRMGETWLTIFPSNIGTDPARNPANTEFAIQVGAPEEVDRLHQALVDAGAKEFHVPEDTWMYDRMRFCCVDDPFGVRIDVYCPLPEEETD